MSDKFVGFETKELKCAKCGKYFTLLRADLPQYTYRLSKTGGSYRYYCRYNCWIGDKKKVRQAYI